jgi:hypothetical protein
MESLFTGLTNAKITMITIVHDYLQISTNKGSISILNSFKYGKTEESCENWEQSISSDIVDKAIEEIVFEEHEYIDFKLSNKNTIRISLADNDYRGPEAIIVHLNTGVIIVE